jgi:hypothetical protein
LFYRKDRVPAAVTGEIFRKEGL